LETAAIAIKSFAESTDFLKHMGVPIWIAAERLLLVVMQKSLWENVASRKRYK
jgi:hypothetical protein